MAKPAPDRVRVSGPLAAFADGFFVDLGEQGYRLWPAQRHLEFLASESLDSTNKYIHADMALKQRALDRTTPPNAKPGRYRAPDPLLAFLESL
jgi:hypothetical protein